MSGKPIDEELISDLEARVPCTDEVTGDYLRRAARALRKALTAAQQQGQGNPWQLAVDQARVTAHLGIAADNATREEAAKQLAELIDWHVAVATDPAVNGGLSLQPVQQGQAVAWMTPESIAHLAKQNGPAKVDAWNCSSGTERVPVYSQPMQQGGGEVEPMTGDLLPCPFCGKSNQDRWPCEWLDGSGANVIRCAWCHGAAPMNVWNRRTAPPSAPEGVGYAKQLATSLWQRHYREDAPQWEPFDDILGLLSQIDNMVSGLTRSALTQQPAAVTQPGAGEVSNGSEQPAAVTEAMVERATMALLGKSHDTAPGIDWRCDRSWTVNKVRKHMRAALTDALAAKPAAVDGAMVERAALAYEAEVDGDTHSPNVPREAMRAALNAALATQHQEPKS